MSEVRVHWLDETSTLRSCGLDDIVSSRGGKWRWVDIDSPDEQVMTIIAEEFSLHPLAAEDVLHRQPRPKIDLYGPEIFIAWLTPRILVDDGVTSEELDVFLGRDYLITAHVGGMHVVPTAEEDIRRVLGRGPDWMLHSIIDRLVDSLLPMVETLADDLDEIEDAMLGEPRRSELARLYQVRRQLVHLHRIVSPERDVLRSLARERDVVSDEAYRYFHDVLDHLARVEDAIETYRDVGAAVMDIYLSAQSNRMNEIMKQLTVVATIFMPLTLISGIYGMNTLKGMWPPADASWSFAAVVATMVVIAVLMSLYFRRKKWW